MELEPVKQYMALYLILKSKYLFVAKNKKQGLRLTLRPYSLAKLKLYLLASLGCV